MAKSKIQKNLSDADMFKGMAEEETFETQMLSHEEAARLKPKSFVKSASNPVHSKDTFYKEFLTDTVETQIGKALLDIKMEYFKEGVGAFSVQVRKEGKQVILVTEPKKVKEEGTNVR